MFKNIKNGWDLFGESFRIFTQHPKLLLPLLITWLIYAPIVLYFEYQFNWNAYTYGQTFGIAFGILFIFALLLSFSCSLLLELIQQMESGRKTSILKAFGETISRNLLKLIPLAFAWASIWFVLTIIQALLSKKKGSDGDKSLTTENAARTLSGVDGKFSFSRYFFKLIEKGVRMIMFLIFPAIAWENLGFFAATKKGLAVFRTHLSEFITGITLTEVAATIIFLPPAILLTLSERGDVVLPPYAWILMTIYLALAWSYSIYLEQMFTAGLYLWHMKWEKAVAKARHEGTTIPSLRDVPQPSVLDDIDELLQPEAISRQR